MFSYYLRLGFRNLRRNPALTALLLLTLAVGVAASMSSFTVLYAMSGDPIPQKSSRLFTVTVDNSSNDGPQGAGQGPNQVSYQDALNLKRAGSAKRQTALYGTNRPVRSGREDLPPFFAEGLAVHTDFFPMFDLEFLQGSAWDVADDASEARVVVIARQLAERVFGSVDAAMGKDLELGDERFRVLGVVEDWQLLPRFHRIAGNSDAEQLFIPFGTAIAQTMDPQGSINCSAGGSEPGFDGLMRSECVWLSYWAELESPAAAAGFRDGLVAYVEEQRRGGRFPREGDVVAIYDVMQWLTFLRVVGDDTRLQTWLAFGFLLVCLVNTIGLMLAKFGARAGEVGVRRALGAPRREVFQQFLTEAGVLGLVGGLLGVAMTFAALWLMAQQSPGLAGFARMDLNMLLLTLGLSLLSALLAGLLPTWRACQVRPAVQLKSQ